jgi:hypothetical protein
VIAEAWAAALAGISVTALVLSASETEKAFLARLRSILQVRNRRLVSAF